MTREHILDVQSFVAGEWIAPDSSAREINSAITGQVMARAGNRTIDMQDVLDHARERGGPALRALTFHDRARMLKALAIHLGKHKQVLYDLSFDTGATASDHKFDIDGGIGTMLVFASKGRREMPDSQIYVDGEVEVLSRNGTFLGLHICTPLHGAAVHINAFNFPVWGMLEKLAPTILAGVPAIVKPATSTCYVTEACVRLMLESGILPDGALQFIAGSTGDLLDRLDAQDVVGFTGSAQTASLLRSAPNIIDNSIRFVAEQDSLNATILGPDAIAGTAEFDLLIKETWQEMTTKAGQKCTAIRRIIVPDDQVSAVISALSERLRNTVIGDPRLGTVGMGPLVSAEQKVDVLAKAALIGTESQQVFGGSGEVTIEGESAQFGSFLGPKLFHCADPDQAKLVHRTEAFGPVATVMGYRDLDHAVEIANRGQGSLVASVFTANGDVARQMALGAGAFHGRLYFNNRDSMGESTGHGAPLPHMVHGGPGRAGGGEEMGGVRGVMHYMQRTAIQGSPDILSAITGVFVKGASEKKALSHPFTKCFDDLKIGETIHTNFREIAMEDIEHFAAFTGDTFYAHMDEDAAKANPFFPGRVAHGYLLLSFAAGLFVNPDPGPVLANTGLDNLRFLKPVQPGDSVKVCLTVKKKTKRNDEYGEVRWQVQVTNQYDDPVAEYELLTMVSYV